MSIDPFFFKCLEIFKKPEIQKEIKICMRPFIELILLELYPYIYLSLLFVIVSFFIVLSIFILLLRNNMSYT